jgi:hypothetical protein
MFTSTSISKIAQQTLLTDAETALIENTTAADVLSAVDQLINDGLSSDHIQWFFQRPFHAFTDGDFQLLIVLCIALRKQMTSVKQILDTLAAEEFVARLLGRTRLFITNRLPSRFEISHALGLAIE